MSVFRSAGALELESYLLQRLRTFPRESDVSGRLLRTICAGVIRAYVRSAHRLSIHGRENLAAQSGSFVIVANHASHLDTLCLLSALPLWRLHRTYPAAASDFFFVNLPRAALAVLAVNAFPFDRHHHLRQSLNRCRELLAQPGNILILYPEGTRTSTGRMSAFKPGIGKLLAGTCIPVIPCYIAGAFEAWPSPQLLPRPRRIKLYVGQARTYCHVPRDCESARWICEDLQTTVEALADRGGEP